MNAMLLSERCSEIYREVSMQHPIVDDQPEAGSSPRARRFVRTQQAILDAARTIIHEQGIDKLSMRAIAERIDYSPAGLYEYYSGKDEIVTEVCGQGHRKLKAYLAAVDTALPAAAYLVEIGLAYIRFALQNPDYFLLMFTTMVAGSESNLRQFPSSAMLQEDSSFPILLQGVQRGLDEGTIRGEPGYGQAEIAYSLWALVHGIAMLRITNLRNYRAAFDEVDRQTLVRFNRSLGI
jgi:AcrR family transcriptional regulator